MQRIPSGHSLRLGVTLSLLWLLLSGHFDGLMLFFGAVSVLVVINIVNRMDEVDKDNYTLYVTTDFLYFILRLAKRILVSNVDVTLRILGIKPTQSQFVKLNVPFKDDLSKVLYANAITLTPGSASVSLENDELLVHTISDSGTKALLEGDIEKIVPRIKHTSFKQEETS